MDRLVGQLGRNGETGCTGGEQKQGWGRRMLLRRRGEEQGEGSATGLDRDPCNHGEAGPLWQGGGKVQCT